MFNSLQCHLNSHSHVCLKPPCWAAQVWPLAHGAVSQSHSAAGSLGCTLPPSTSPHPPTRTCNAGGWGGCGGHIPPLGG